MTEFVLLIVIFAAAAGLTGVLMLALGWLVGPKRAGAVKEMPYESGMDPIHDARRRFDVRFHLVAIAFLVFDVELLFLYPWAVAARATGIPADDDRVAVASAPEDHPASLPVDGDETPAESTPAESTPGEETPAAAVSETRRFANQPADRSVVFGGVLFFFALLVVGLAYEWKKGILQWR